MGPQEPSKEPEVRSPDPAEGEGRGRPPFEDVLGRGWGGSGGPAGGQAWPALPGQADSWGRKGASRRAGSGAGAGAGAGRRARSRSAACAPRCSPRSPPLDPGPSTWRDGRPGAGVGWGRGVGLRGDSSPKPRGADGGATSRTGVAFPQPQIKLLVQFRHTTFYFTRHDRGEQTVVQMQWKFICPTALRLQKTAYK